MTIRELLEVTSADMKVKVNLKDRAIEGYVWEIFQEYEELEILDVEVKYIDRYYSRLDMCIYTQN